MRSGNCDDEGNLDSKGNFDDKNNFNDESISGYNDTNRISRRLVGSRYCVSKLFAYGK